MPACAGARSASCEPEGEAAAGGGEPPGVAVEPGGEVVWEAAPQNPFAIFGGLASTGTPL